MECYFYATTTDGHSHHFTVPIKHKEPDWIIAETIYVMTLEWLEANKIPVDNIGIRVTTDFKFGLLSEEPFLKSVSKHRVFMYQRNRLIFLKRFDRDEDSLKAFSCMVQDYKLKTALPPPPAPPTEQELSIARRRAAILNRNSRS